MSEEKEGITSNILSYFVEQRAEEDVEVYNKLLGEILSSSSIAIKQTSDTDATLTDTIDFLATRLENIETSVGEVVGSAHSLSDTFGNQVSEQIELKIAPIKSELMSIKQEVLPELASAKGMLKSLEKFLKNNAAFLASAVEVQGLIPALKAELESFSRRLEALESIVNKAWDRRLTFLSLVVAVISIGVAIYAVFSN